MPALSKARHFEIVRSVLASAEEQGSVLFADAAASVDLPEDELRRLLEPILYLEFRTPDGQTVGEERAFLVTEDGYLMVSDGHWLRDLDADAPAPDVALRLLIAGLTMEALAGAPTPDLDDAVKKLRGVVAVDLHVPVDHPPCLDAVERAWREHRSVRFNYVAEAASAPNGLEALPHRVFCRWGHWYLTARIPAETWARTFRIDRMRDATVGSLEFDPPDDVEIPDWFDLSAHERTVRVRCSPEMLAVLPQPLGQGERTELGDGRVEVDLTVAGDRRLEHLLVCLPPEAEVVSPSEYNDLRREHAKRLLASLSSGD